MRPALFAALALAGCGEATAPEPDAELVDALVEVHLADARAALDTTGRDLDALGDSLKAVALATHGLDSSAMARHLDALADDPALARATYAAVDAALVGERRGTPPDTTDR